MAAESGRPARNPRSLLLGDDRIVPEHASPRFSANSGSLLLNEVFTPDGVFSDVLPPQDHPVLSCGSISSEGSRPSSPRASPRTVGIPFPTVESMFQETLETAAGALNITIDPVNEYPIRIDVPGPPGSVDSSSARSGPSPRPWFVGRQKSPSARSPTMQGPDSPTRHCGWSSASSVRSSGSRQSSFDSAEGLWKRPGISPTRSPVINSRVTATPSSPGTPGSAQLRSQMPHSPAAHSPTALKQLDMWKRTSVPTAPASRLASFETLPGYDVPVESDSSGSGQGGGAAALLPRPAENLPLLLEIGTPDLGGMGFQGRPVLGGFDLPVKSPFAENPDFSVVPVVSPESGSQLSFGMSISPSQEKSSQEKSQPGNERPDFGSDSTDATGKLPDFAVPDFDSFKPDFGCSSPPRNADFGRAAAATQPVNLDFGRVVPVPSPIQATVSDTAWDTECIPAPVSFGWPRQDSLPDMEHMVLEDDVEPPAPPPAPKCRPPIPPRG